MVRGLRKPWVHAQAERWVLKDFPSPPRAPVSPLFPTEPEPYSLLSQQATPVPKGITCTVREGDILLRNRACAGHRGCSQNPVIWKSHYQLLAVAVPGSSWPQPSGDVGQLQPPAGSLGLALPVAPREPAACAGAASCCASRPLPPVPPPRRGRSGLSASCRAWLIADCSFFFSHSGRKEEKINLLFIYFIFSFAPAELLFDSLFPPRLHPAAPVPAAALGHGGPAPRRLKGSI